MNPKPRDETIKALPRAKYLAGLNLLDRPQAPVSERFDQRLASAADKYTALEHLVSTRLALQLFLVTRLPMVRTKGLDYIINESTIHPPLSSLWAHDMGRGLR